MSKAYAGVTVLKGVDLSVEDGEIHALLGANGAGKSTLIKCISGAVQPDAGEIMVGGQHFPVHSTQKKHAAAGVAVIYQELALAMSLNVTDNIFLGQELRVGPFVRRRAQRVEAAQWLDQLGVDLDPKADLAKVSSAEMQLVEIVKSLRAHPKVLILDEPTASLTEREAEQLRQHLLSLKQQNLPVLYVTHRLAEVFGLADRVTVLRGGDVVLTSPGTRRDPRGFGRGDRRAPAWCRPVSRRRRQDQGAQAADVHQPAGRPGHRAAGPGATPGRDPGNIWFGRFRTHRVAGNYVWCAPAA